MKNLVCALVVLVLSGCASVVNDKSQNVKIVASNGQEIKGEVMEYAIIRKTENGKTKKFHGQTVAASFNGKTNAIPLTRSSKDKTVVVENPECMKETEIKSSVAPIFFGNLIIGGLAGSLTDAVTEKMWRYDDKIVVFCK